MKTLTVGELKARFSEVLAQVKAGKEIIVSVGRKREKVAVLVPYSQYRSKPERKLGLLKGRGQCVIRKDFKLSDEEMLTS